jgi:hypothetical protein
MVISSSLLRFMASRHADLDLVLLAIALLVLLELEQSFQTLPTQEHASNQLITLREGK